MNIRILIADTYPCVLKGIRDLLEEQPDMEVIAEATDGEMMLDMVRKHCPGVVITEIYLPLLNGFDAAQTILKEYPSLKIIAYTELCEKKSVGNMICNGAKGYLVKTCPLEELVTAVRKVHENHICLCQRSEDILAEDYAIIASGKKLPPKPLLTIMERRITQLYGEEYSTKEIAGILHLSVKRIGNYRTVIFKKLGVKGITGLIKYAIKENLIPFKKFD